LAVAIAVAAPEPVAAPGVVAAYGVPAYGYAAPVLAGRAIVYG